MGSPGHQNLLFPGGASRGAGEQERGCLPPGLLALGLSSPRWRLRTWEQFVEAQPQPSSYPMDDGLVGFRSQRSRPSCPVSVLQTGYVATLRDWLKGLPTTMTLSAQLPPDPSGGCCVDQVSSPAVPMGQGRCQGRALQPGRAPSLPSQLMGNRGETFPTDFLLVTPPGSELCAPGECAPSSTAFLCPAEGPWLSL